MFRPHTFEQKLEEDNRKVAQMYFDPLEDDDDNMNGKVQMLEKILQKKQVEMEEATQKLDFIRSAHKSCSVDLAHLQKQKESLENENLSIREKAEKYSSLKELNIQIDLLKSSNAGVEILRQKYARLLNRLNLERIVYEELSDEYFKIESDIKKKRKMEKDIVEVKSASEEQDFHIKRHEDIMPKIKEQIKPCESSRKYY